MATNPTFQLSLPTFPQRFDGATTVRLRFLCLPQGDPLSPLFPAAGAVAASPAFADAHPKFVARLIPSLAALPDPANVTATVPLTVPAPANPRALFEALATQFDLAPDPPGRPPRRLGYATRKYLPESYRNAFAFDRPSTPFAVTDDTYQCMLRHPPATGPQPPPPSAVSWGRVIGFALRQPLLAAGLGLVYETTVAVPSPTFFADGGWLYVDLDPAGDFAPQVTADPTLLQSYAARLPPLSAARPLFAAVLFPVTAGPPAGSYDDAVVEAESYDDGFVKIVHGAQPDRTALLDTRPDRLPPAADIGIQLGWDDEQVTTWFNRQVDAAAIDAPFGVAGYRVDVRAHGSRAWHSLCRVTASNLAVATVPLGKFDGELSVEAVPIRHDPAQPGEWWLPSYFTHWRGTSLVVTDPVALQLHGTVLPAASQPYTAVDDQAVPLRYGRSYDVRVRMADLTRGGPAADDDPANPGPAPIGTLPFRRLVPFLPVTVTDLDSTATTAAPQLSYTVARPRLTYPAAVFAGVPGAVAALIADLPAAQADHREASVFDPDAVLLSIEVQVRQPSTAAVAFAPGNEPYSSLYTTTRPFPADPTAPLTLAVSFIDVPDLADFPPQPATGPVVLPRARGLRLVLRAAPIADPTLAYWGSTAATVGQTVEVLTGADGSDERDLFAPDVAANRIRGIFLQPDPVPTPALVAALAASGRADTAPADLAHRLADALGLTVANLTYSGQPGERVAFGCSAAIRHALSPEHGAVTFAANTELTHQWLVVVSLRLARDWSWNATTAPRFEVRDGTGDLVGAVGLTDAVSMTALDTPDWSGSRLIFIDAVDPKPPAGQFPGELDLSYTVTAVLPGPPAQLDPPVVLPLHLPIAAPPTQTPKLVSAGLALSPFSAAADYSATDVRRKVLWVEFDAPPADPDDIYFARVLAYAPDPLLTGTPLAPTPVDVPAEPPLPVDPELIRTIAPAQSDDSAGLGAMQSLIPSDSPVHFGVPLPPGLTADSPELFGLFTYELRVGHRRLWSTAQARFGPPLRVAGVQHPVPPLLGAALALPSSIGVSARYAMPVFAGQNLLPPAPRTQLWTLLYTQVTAADGGTPYNVLLGRRRLGRDTGFPPSRGGAGTAWSRAEIRVILASLALPVSSPLSVLVVETMPTLGPFADPLGGDLGQVRFLRTSPLIAVSAQCDGGWA